MICKNCGTVNEDSSKFCKECGRKMEPSAAVSPDDYLRIGELIYTAYRHSESGRLDDAILACQGALALNEVNASAYALLASLYERKGDINNAITAYERVVSLNPNSAADRQKLEDLRVGRFKMTSAVPMKRKSGRLVDRIRPYAPHVVSACVVLLVLVLGLSLVLRASRSHAGRTDSAESRQTATSVQPPQSQGFMSGGQAAPGQQANAPQMGPGQQPGQGTTTDQQQSETAESAPGEAGQGPTKETPASQRSGIPSVPLPGSGTARVQPKPLSPQPGPIQVTQQPSSQSPVIVPVIEPSPAPAPAPRTNPAPAPAPAPVRHATGDPESRASQLQMSGKYRDAISSYRDSLSQTTDPGRVYQQMALCHQRLGEHGNAIDCYNQAIRAYRDQLAAGRDASEVQRNIRSCEAGIQVSRNHSR